MTGPWSCPCPGPARGTQSTGQVVESAIGGFALQVIAGRRPHGASAVSGGVARYVDRESGPSPAPQYRYRTQDYLGRRTDVALVRRQGRVGQ
jgi:hypothetical protein